MLNEYGRKNPLLLACRFPKTLAKLREKAWQDLLLRAQNSGLLPRLYRLLDESELLKQIPEKARLQLTNARMFVERNQTDIRFEVHRVGRALSGLGIPIVLLKGAAYLFADIPLAQRRLVSDLDLLFEKKHLDLVEQTLRAAGWQMADETDYDNQYYRKWMHEIPPMWHPERLFAVDIHHTIIPTTSRYTPDTEALIASAIQLDDSTLKVLCPADMVLHGAVHFFNEEFILGLRDLADLQDLLEHYGKTEGFWNDLLARAELHDLRRVLYYLLRYSQRVFDTNVPRFVDIEASAHGPTPIIRFVMDRLVLAALMPPTFERPYDRRAIALRLLFVRSHWLKMPPLLLARHLTTKAVHRLRKRFR